MLVGLNDVLRPAQKGGYAVGLFNTINLEMAVGVFAAAERLRSPVIVGSAEVLLPFGPLEELSYLLLPMAKRASVPVVLHFDHGTTLENTVKAIDLGFSSVMYDRSDRPFEDNLKEVKELTDYAHKKGVTVEAELGHVGTGEDLGFLTDPDTAKEFAVKTGVDALAVSIGTVHGPYLKKPCLDIELLGKIRSQVDVPLVLHGGSGLSEEQFKECIKNGICKVNIFTDINKAAAKAAGELYTDGKAMTDLIPSMYEAVRVATEEKMLLFGSDGKAL
jgi:fructose-bisphosphate aldolase class II